MIYIENYNGYKIILNRRKMSYLVEHDELYRKKSLKE